MIQSIQQAFNFYVLFLVQRLDLPVKKSSWLGFHIKKMLEQSDHVEFRRGIGDSALPPHQSDFPPSPYFGAGMRPEPEFLNV